MRRRNAWGLASVRLANYGGFGLMLVLLMLTTAATAYLIYKDESQ